MSSRLLTCLLAATALLSVGCDDSTGLDDDDAANVRIVNASPAVGTLSATVDGDVQTGASNVAFLNAGQQCTRVNAAEPQLGFQQTGGNLQIPAQNFTFTGGGRSTVVVAGTTAANLRVMNIDDPVTPTLQPGRARLRVVNGRTSAPMDVYVTPWSEAPGNPTQINTTTNVATGWVDVPAGSVAVRMVNPANQATIDTINLFLAEGQELVLVAVDPATGQGGLRWVGAEACSAP